MEDRRAAALDRWLESLPVETVERYFLLLDELCRGLDVSKHEQFGFLRLRAEFETSGEIFGCSRVGPDNGASPVIASRLRCAAWTELMVRQSRTIAR